MPAAGLYRRIELADGHVRYEPVDDEIARLRAALKPFATMAVDIEREHPGWYHVAFAFTDPQLPMTWLIDARAAYEQ